MKLQVLALTPCVPPLIVPSLPSTGEGDFAARGNAIS